MITSAGTSLSASDEAFMKRRRLSKTVTPLRAIFWGGLLCVFDFNLVLRLGGPGIVFDVLNDGLGMVLITGGVIVLAAQKVDSLYDWLMSTISAIAITFTVGSFVRLLQPDWLVRVQSLMPVFRVLGYASTVAFCIAMIRLSAVIATPAIERSWWTTTTLFAVCVLAPGVLLSVVSLLFPETTPRFPYLAFLLFPGYTVALIHFFVSTSRMTAFARDRAPKAAQRSVV